MPVVNYTEFRQHLADHMDEVVESRAPLTVTRQGAKGNVVVMSEEEFEGWRETVHLLSSPANATRLLRSIEAANAGRLVARDVGKAVAAGEDVKHVRKPRPAGKPLHGKFGDVKPAGRHGIVSDAHQMRAAAAKAGRSSAGKQTGSMRTAASKSSGTKTAGSTSSRRGGTARRTK